MNENSSDIELIREILKGETQKYSLLVSRYERLVFTLALRMLKTREDAEETAQDVFVKAFQALGTFKGDAKFSSWLYRITYNKSLDMLAKKKRHRYPRIYEDLSQVEPDDGKNAFESLQRAEQQELLKKTINSLAAEESFIITLYYYEEQNIGEIASVTGLSESNVKVKLYRARKKMFVSLNNTPAFNKKEWL